MTFILWLTARVGDGEVKWQCTHRKQNEAKTHSGKAAMLPSSLTPPLSSRRNLLQIELVAASVGEEEDLEAAYWFAMYDRGGYDGMCTSGYSLSKSNIMAEFYADA